MIAFASSFLNEYFIQPIVNPSVPGYNLVNTLTYGIILLGLTFYVIYPRLTKHGYVFDWSFLKMLLPYIVFGTSLRVLEDQKILTRSINPLELGFYIYTPGIWFLTFALVVLGIALGKKLGKGSRENEQRITGYAGAAIALPLLLYNLLNAHEIIAGIGIILLVGAVSSIILKIGKKASWTFLEKPLAKAAMVGQLLDTSATFVALEFFECGEQHVIPRLLFGAFGNISFFFVKIPLILLILYWLHREYVNGKEPDSKMHGFILLFIAILGLAPGGRNLITVMAGTCSP